jgi:hypothetical protein
MHADFEGVSKKTRSADVDTCAAIGLFIFNGDHNVLLSLFTDGKNLWTEVSIGSRAWRFRRQGASEMNRKRDYGRPRLVGLGIS